MKKLLICFVLLLSGCSAGSKIAPIPIEPQREFAADFDKTWGATVAALTEMNFSMTSIDKASGLINTNEIVTSEPGMFVSAHLYGERGFQGSIKEIASAKALLKTSNGKTSVRLIVNIKEYAPATGYFAVKSKGVLEKMIYDKIQTALVQ